MMPEDSDAPRSTGTRSGCSWRNAAAMRSREVIDGSQRLVVQPPGAGLAVSAARGAEPFHREAEDTFAAWLTARSRSLSLAVAVAVAVCRRRWRGRSPLRPVPLPRTDPPTAHAQECACHGTTATQARTESRLFMHGHGTAGAHCGHHPDGGVGVTTATAKRQQQRTIAPFGRTPRRRAESDPGGAPCLRSTSTPGPETTGPRCR